MRIQSAFLRCIFSVQAVLAWLNMLQVKAWQIDLALMHFGRSKSMCIRIGFVPQSQGSFYASYEVDDKILFLCTEVFILSYAPLVVYNMFSSNRILICCAWLCFSAFADSLQQM